MPDSIILKTDREPGEYIESRDVNQIAQAINHLASLSGTSESEKITDATTVGRAMLTAPSKAAGRSVIGAGTGTVHSVNGTGPDSNGDVTVAVGEVATWDTLQGKPAFIGAGNTQIAARIAIGAGTSDVQLGTTWGSAARGDHLHDGRYIRTVNGTGPDSNGDVTVEGGGTNGPVEWDDVQDKPESFPPTDHGHAADDLTSGQVAPARLGTGPANSSTFLRGDGQWVVPPTGDGGGDGGPLTSYSQVSDLPDYPAAFPPDLTSVTPQTIGAQPEGDYADAQHDHDGVYVKPADLPAAPTWDTLADKPLFVAAGSSQAIARQQIGAGTSNVSLGGGYSNAARGNHLHDDRYYTQTQADDRYTRHIVLDPGDPVPPSTPEGTLILRRVTVGGSRS